jgi:hypothetical protein
MMNMWKIKLVLIAALLLSGSASSALAQAAFLQRLETRAADSVRDLWLDISLGPPLVEWFNRVARPDDIARVERIQQIGLLSEITAGRKLVVFKSVADAEQLVPMLADQIDIIGYNLEHAPVTPPGEQADPLSSVQRMHDLAREYDLLLAFGPDHDYALSHGAAVAPYVDIFVLQVQRVQTEPQTVYEFTQPLIAQLREANPDLEISVQVRTEGDVIAIVDLIEAIEDSLDGVSILTSPETVDVAEALVTELRTRQASAPGSAATQAVLAGQAGTPPAAGVAPASNAQQSGSLTAAVIAGAVAGAVVGGATAAWVCSRRRAGGKGS